MIRPVMVRLFSRSTRGFTMVRRLPWTSAFPKKV